MQGITWDTEDPTHRSFAVSALIDYVHVLLPYGCLVADVLRVDVANTWWRYYTGSAALTRADVQGKASCLPRHTMKQS